MREKRKRKKEEDAGDVIKRRENVTVITDGGAFPSLDLMRHPTTSSAIIS